MANLKNITDVPVVESAEGLNLIVNDNGAAKQIAASAVGKVKTVNGTEPDASGNVQIDTAFSWNDLKDKPFYTEMDADGNETVHKLDAKYLGYDAVILFEESISKDSMSFAMGSYTNITQRAMTNQTPRVAIVYTYEYGGMNYETATAYDISVYSDGSQIMLQWLLGEQIYQLAINQDGSIPTFSKRTISVGESILIN